MELLRQESAEQVADAAAHYVSSCARKAIATRGRFTLALSGGSTPWLMLNTLAGQDLPWDKFHVFQVDERVAPDGHSDRNLTHIRAQFTDRVGLAEDCLHAMPVNGKNLGECAQRYGDELNRWAGQPAILDLVHLGIGSDGHTASLLPGDNLLNEMNRDVGTTPPYQGRPRMSLTYPLINRARNILWLVTGADKAPMLGRLLEGDPGIPAGRVNGDRATIITDTPV